MTDIDISLLSDYLVEAAEHLEEMESLLLSLAQAPEDTNLLNEIFRPIHSIKGAAQFIGLERSSRLAHRLEDLLDLLRKGERASSPATVELLIAARDQIVCLADELENSQSETLSIDDIVAQITQEIEGTATPQEMQADVALAESGREADDEVIIDVSLPVEAVIPVDSMPEEAADATSQATAYTEEGDEELFSIFLENLQEKIDLLRTQAAAFETTADKADLLVGCVANVQALQSSANYMGYAELIDLYNNWLEDIDAVQEALAANEEVPYDFMDGYLSEIEAQFPQLAQPAPATAVDIEEDISATAIDIKEDINESEIIDHDVDDNSGIDMSLLSDYLIEASEHLEEMESLLLSLVQAPEDTDLLNEIFRPIHSIKGAAQFIGLERSSRLAHRLEDLLDLLRKGERASSPATVELLIAARDQIVCLADELENSQSETSSIDDIVAQITQEIEGTAKEQDTQAAVAVAETEDEAEFESVPVDASVATNQAAAYTEENDQELFSIFLNNLQEKFDLLRTQATAFENAADKTDLLLGCVESVRALQSSANYMGYVELTDLYKNWLEDIDVVQEALLANEEVPYDFMDGYLSEIVSLFPQINDNNVAADTVSEQTSEALSTQLEATQSATGKTEDDLHKKLSNALDAAASSSDDAEYELLHGVFEEMISERDDAPVDERSEIDESSKTTQVNHALANKAEAKPVVDTDKSVNPVVTQTKPEVSKSTVANAAEKVDKKSLQVAPDKKDKRQNDRRAEENERRAVDRRSAETVLKKSVRVEAEKIDSLINQVGELVVDRAYFYQLYDDMRGLQKHFKDELGLDQKEMKQVRAFTYRMGEAIASLSRTSNELQEGVMKVRMLPISQLFNRYPRLVHDLTRNNNKKVNLKVEGEDTELDKIVVEKLSDPLIHIIRNAVDHGLEDAAERTKAGKSDTGILHLKSYHESNQVVVEIKDDGRGIDEQLVKAKAIEKGMVTKEEISRMTSQEVIRLITSAGFSTAKEITDTSGRGVGMDVVRKNIEKLNGTMDIESKPGKGTTIRLKIPLTLAIIPAHLVRVGDNMYTIPLANIEETLRINNSETTIIEGTEVVYLRGKTLPVIHLSSLFSTQSDAKEKDNFYIVVVNTGTQKMGLVVDELLGQEEVVIKPLIDYLRDKSGFSGATIIGDGNISLILDIYEIASMTAEKQSRRQHELSMARKSGDAGQISQAVG